LITLLANLAPALFLAGLAWFLQIVQLPLLADRPEFGPWIREHRLRNTLLMTLPMIVELAASLLLYIDSRALPHVTSLILTLIIWFATLAGIVPGFNKLTRGYDMIAVNRLIAWNAVRTLCWTARSGILLYIIASRVRI
jgi:hypothetical protein